MCVCVCVYILIAQTNWEVLKIFPSPNFFLLGINTEFLNSAIKEKWQMTIDFRLAVENKTFRRNSVVWRILVPVGSFDELKFTEKFCSIPRRKAFYLSFIAKGKHQWELCVIDESETVLFLRKSSKKGLSLLERAGRKFLKFFL